MRTIGVVTTARADYGIYGPLLQAISADPDLRLLLFVSGMHLSPEFGSTVRAIEEDGHPIAARIESLLASDSPQAVSKSIGLGVLGFADAFAQSRPDLLIVLGDRFEMLSAVVAAASYRIPVAHLHGGELSEGALDEQFRHAMTKLSHIHFVAADVFRRRLVQLGEEPWRVTVCGALGLDNLRETRLLSRGELEQCYGIRLVGAPLLVTFHPATLDSAPAERQADELLAALDKFDMTVVATAPNADTGGRAIARRLREYAAGRKNAVLVDSLGTQAYFSMMALAAAMVGNSSSGIIEAASFGLPVVNVGNRQKGRLRGANVIDVACDHAAITAGIAQAMEPAFRKSLAGMVNPYGDGRAVGKILQVLKSVDLVPALTVKSFHDLPAAAPAKG